MRKLRVLITAGPTREYLDPVRFITNDSSGEMGISLANAFAQTGAIVTLVLGPSLKSGSSFVRIYRVTSALEMSSAVKKNLSRSDVFISTAAVSDYRFERQHLQKVKKASPVLNIKLVKNPDILFEAGKWKSKRNKSLPILIGFALETTRLPFYARKKMIAKNCDLIIGNTPQSFSSQKIRALWMEKQGKAQWLPLMTKKRFSKRVVSWVTMKLK